ncbi:MAG: hypothetical protein AB1408_13700, partial [Pseudomonadota bacterium]
MKEQELLARRSVPWQQSPNEMTQSQPTPEIMARIERARALFDSVPADEMVDSVSRLFELQPDEATDEFI